MIATIITVQTIIIVLLYFSKIKAKKKYRNLVLKYNKLAKENKEIRKEAMKIKFKKEPFFK